MLSWHVEVVYEDNKADSNGRSEYPFPSFIEFLFDIVLQLIGDGFCGEGDSYELILVLQFACEHVNYCLRFTCASGACTEHVVGVLDVDVHDVIVHDLIFGGNHNLEVVRGRILVETVEFEAGFPADVLLFI